MIKVSLFFKRLHVFLEAFQVKLEAFDFFSKNKLLIKFCFHLLELKFLFVNRDCGIVSFFFLNFSINVVYELIAFFHLLINFSVSKHFVCVSHNPFLDFSDINVLALVTLSLCAYVFLLL